MGMKQTDRVLAFIEGNGSISDVEAFRQLGIRRLAARIKDLRDAGVDIATMTERHDGGTHARYYIPAQPVAAGQLELRLSAEGPSRADDRPLREASKGDFSAGTLPR